MASRTKSYKIGADLDDAAEILAAVNGYPSGAALIKGMLRYALLTQAKHSVSLPWSLLPLAVQDKLDAALLTLVTARRGMKSAEAATITVEEILNLAEKVKAENPDLFKGQ